MHIHTVGFQAACQAVAAKQCFTKGQPCGPVECDWVPLSTCQHMAVQLAGTCELSVVLLQ